MLADSLYILQFVAADTLANCTYEDAIGTWNVFAGDFVLNCSTSQLVPKSPQLKPD